MMATNRFSSRFGGSGATSRTSNSSTRGVSPARLRQKSGPGGTFNGYTKVNRGDGTFRMRKSGR